MLHARPYAILQAVHTDKISYTVHQELANSCLNYPTYLPWMYKLYINGVLVVYYVKQTILASYSSDLLNCSIMPILNNANFEHTCIPPALSAGHTTVWKPFAASLSNSMHL